MLENTINLYDSHLFAGNVVLRQNRPTFGHSSPSGGFVNHDFFWVYSL